MAGSSWSRFRPGSGGAGDLPSPSALGCAALLAWCGSCADTALPGTQLGTYTVTGTLGTNTCGAGLGAPSPWKFDIQMSEQKNTLYLSTLDGNPPLSSTLVGQSATLTASVTGNVDGSADAGPGPCSMTRNETVRVNLASSSPPSSFTGTLEYDFGVVAGSDCSDQLSANGGGYDALPCSMTYSISGARQ
jgi:hypothetical protein